MLADKPVHVKEFDGHTIHYPPTFTKPFNPLVQAVAKALVPSHVAAPAKTVVAVVGSAWHGIHLPYAK